MLPMWNVEVTKHKNKLKRKTLDCSKSKVWVDLATAYKQKRGGLTDEVHAILSSSRLNNMLGLYGQQLVMIKGYSLIQTSIFLDSLFKPSLFYLPIDAFIDA